MYRQTEEKWSEYLKIPEVARRLDVSEKTARRYIRSGELPSTFIGGAYRVSEEDLANYQKDAIVKPEELRKVSSEEPAAEIKTSQMFYPVGNYDPGYVFWTSGAIRRPRVAVTVR